MLVLDEQRSVLKLILIKVVLIKSTTAPVNAEIAVSLALVVRAIKSVGGELDRGAD